MSEFNRLIPRTDEERIEDLEAALRCAQEELARLYAEKDKIHKIIANQKDLIIALSRYVLDESEE